jgi:alpha-amylase
LTNNFTLIQFFHWYYPGDGTLWKNLEKEVPRLSESGITAAWVPPPYKAGSGADSVGYDAYDLFDLGEFEQQGSIATKYGTKNDLLQAINKAHSHNVQIIADTILNHKAHGDELEKIQVRKVDPENRTKFISEQMEIEAWTKFYFPGRNKKYSEFIWDHNCFSGLDWAEDRKEKAIFKILNEYGEEWEELSGTEKGNYDYLSFDDIEFRNKSVREELKYWGKWFLETTGIDGFRLDAVKHITPDFINEWIDHMKSISQKKLFFMGEYWNDQDAQVLKKFTEVSGDRLQLVDGTLHQNFYQLSSQGKEYDLTKIFDNTLTQQKPELSVTFVSNHDSQPLQKMEKLIADWCNVLAYALILLRQQGIPCVFYPDLYGAEYTGKGIDGKDYHITLNKVKELPALLMIRSQLAYGKQCDYFDHEHTIGWTREGISEKPSSGCAVLLSNGDDGFKYMEIGESHTGEIFVDCLGKIDKEIVVDKKGGAEFHCKNQSVSVWIKKEIAGRMTNSRFA